MTRARRLYEQGGSKERLWEYVTRWYRWLHGGLKGLVTRKGGDTTLLHLHPKATQDSLTPYPPVDDRLVREWVLLHSVCD